MSTNDSDLSGSILFEGLKEARTKIRTTGFLLILLGVICCIFSQIIGLMISTIVGITFIIGGIFYFFHAFGITGFAGKLINILFALLIILTGGSLVFHPLLGAITLVQISLFYYFLAAIFQIFGAFQFKPRDGWWILLINGLLSLMFAIVLIKNPLVTVEIIGFLLGLNLIFKGIGFLSLSYTK